MTPERLVTLDDVMTRLLDIEARLEELRVYTDATCTLLSMVGRPWEVTK